MKRDGIRRKLMIKEDMICPEVNKDDVDMLQFTPRVEKATTLLNKFFFPHLPEHYSLSKKLYILKHNSHGGKWYKRMMDVISVLLCILFLIGKQHHNYHAIHIIFALETTLIGFILVDTLLNCYIARQYVTTMSFIIDICTIFPTMGVVLYVFIAGMKMTYYEYEYLGLVKLAWILRLFRTLSSIKLRFQRSIFKLFLTFACLAFIASGFLNVFENVFPQNELECQYVNSDTNWKPSCSEVTAADEMTYCDCEDNNCEVLHDVS